ncbi:MAG: hypothetical protein RPS47_07560 [Colwellia sp.]
MSVAQDDLDKLFSSSLTEFMLIIAFMFVLISVGLKIQSDAAIKLANSTENKINEIVDTEEEVKRLEEIFGVTRQDDLPLSKRLEIIRSSLPDNISIDDDWDTLFKIKEYLEENGEVDDLLKEMEGKIENLSRVNKHLVARTGLDKQPCEVNSTGKLKYLAEVELHDSFTIFRKLSDHHLNLDSLSELKLSYVDFESLSKVYFNWSNDSDNECRFFVKVFDYSTTKANYKSAISIVERYFYKYESRT